MPQSSERSEPPLHAVQFYDDDALGMQNVARFLSAGMNLGNSAIVIATQAHRTLIESALALHGHDMDAASADGSYQALDAATTLASFSDMHTPSQERYDAVIGTMLRDASAKSRTGKVHAYGELVALLCEEGHPKCAVSLERMWNELAKELQFSLFCSYPMRLVMDTCNETLSEICGEHNEIIKNDENE